MEGDIGNLGLVLESWRKTVKHIKNETSIFGPDCDVQSTADDSAHVRDSGRQNEKHHTNETPAYFDLASLTVLRWDERPYSGPSGLLSAPASRMLVGKLYWPSGLQVMELECIRCGTLSLSMLLCSACAASHD